MTITCHENHNILSGLLHIVNESSHQEISFLLNERFGSFFLMVIRAFRFPTNCAQNKGLSCANMHFSAAK